jgi:alkylhydroperoxidase family enzyme
MPIIAPLATEDLDPGIADSLTQLPPLNIFRTLAHAPTALPEWLRSGAALLGRLDLDAVLRELVILRIAERSGSAYEWAQHEPIALAVGAAPHDVDALRAGLHPGGDPRVLAALQFTDAALDIAEISPPVVSAAVEHLGERQTVELLLVIAHYRGVAQITTSLQIDLDAPAATQILESVREETGADR